MSKPDLSSLYKLEFYKKQDNWRLASKAKRRGKAKSSTRGDFNKTYVLNKSTANITTKLNDAFLETEHDSAAEENGHHEKFQNETQKINSFNELWSNSEELEREEKTTTPKPQNSESPSPETIPKPQNSEPPETTPKIEGCLSPNLELPKVFLPDLPLHADLWSEKVDFELNDLLKDPTSQSHVSENTEKATDPNILVNLLKKRKFFINELDKIAVVENSAIKENNEYLPQDLNQNNPQNVQEQFDKEDILTKLKRKIFRANLLNNNYLIPNANQQPVLEGNNFESYFNNIEDAKNSLSISVHEKNFEIANQEQRNFLESTLPTTLHNDLESNEITGNNIFVPNYKNNVKPFGSINKDFQYLPTDFTENCYLNKNMTSPQNQYIKNNFKPVSFNQNFKPFPGDSQASSIIMNNYETHLKNCQILSKSYHPEAVAKNFQTDPKSFQIDLKNCQINPNNFNNDSQNLQNDAHNFHNHVINFQNKANHFQSNANLFQNDLTNFQFDAKNSNIVDHNSNTVPYTPMMHQNFTQLQRPTHHQIHKIPQNSPIPQNHQIFVRNPEVYSQIEHFSEVFEDPLFERTKNFKDQVLDDIDGIWSEGRGALDSANQWLNLVVDEDNLDPNMKEICREIEDLNMNVTSSTDSATFMRGAALVPHSSEIEIDRSPGGSEKYELVSLIKKHAGVLKCLLSRANSEHSICMQTQSSISQQKRHSATNTTPDQSCDFYPTRDVGSNTPLIDPTDPIVGGDFDAKLDQLREKLAQDQEKFENCAADQKLYTVFNKFQQYYQNPAVDRGNNQLQLQQNVQLIEHKFEPSSEQNLQRVEQIYPSTERKIHAEHNFNPSEHNFQLPDRQMQQVEHNFQSPERQLQQVEHNIQSTEHNVQQIEHKSGHYNMRTVNKTEMGSHNQKYNNFGPYGRQKRSHNKYPFNYLSNNKINQLNNRGLD